MNYKSSVSVAALLVALSASSAFAFDNGGTYNGVPGGTDVIEAPSVPGLVLDTQGYMLWNTSTNKAASTSDNALNPDGTLKANYVWRGTAGFLTYQQVVANSGVTPYNTTSDNGTANQYLVLNGKVVTSAEALSAGLSTKSTAELALLGYTSKNPSVSTTTTFGSLSIPSGYSYQQVSSGSWDGATLKGKNGAVAVVGPNGQYTLSGANGVTTTGALKSGSLTTTGDATVGGGLTVNGTTNLNGDTHVNGNWTMKGGTTYTGTNGVTTVDGGGLTTTGDATIGGKLTVGGVDVGQAMATGTANSAGLAALTGRVDGHDVQINAITGQVTQNGQDIGNLKTLTATHDVQITTLGGQVLDLQGVTTTQGGQISSLQGTVDGHTAQITGLGTTFDGHTQQIGTIKGDIVTLQTDAGVLTGKVDAQGVIIDGHGNRIGMIEGCQTSRIVRKALYPVRNGVLTIVGQLNTVPRSRA